MDRARRTFLKKATAGTAALTIGGVLPGFSPKSYARILGASNRIRIACMGVNSRGMGVADTFTKQENCEILYVCDVDSRAADKCLAAMEKKQQTRPRAVPDFRKALEDKQLDALIVTAPDHWHAPAGILACQAGKHAYIEKPASHNPREGELLVAAAKKYNRVVQMGNQRRSWPNVAAALQELQAGVLGRTYYAKTWYTANRPSIGIGKQTGVPAWLNFDLWQGPAPRVAFRDNIVHYNWHWFWNWGTAESGNNGIHQLDLARLGLGVEYPIRVTSSGGRYRYQDDQETPDTHNISLEFKDNKSITFEGHSCNGRTLDGSRTAVTFYGEKGALLIDGNAYTIYDLENKVVKEVKNTTPVEANNPVSPAASLEYAHAKNFLDGIRNDAPLTSPILSGHQSTLLSQLGNIAQRTGRTLNTNPENGYILNDPEAMQYWGREYAPGWEPKV